MDYNKENMEALMKSWHFKPYAVDFQTQVERLVVMGGEVDDLTGKRLHSEEELRGQALYVFHIGKEIGLDEEWIVKTIDEQAEWYQANKPRGDEKPWSFKMIRDKLAGK